MSQTNYGANMLLFTTFWGQNKTFKLMPINLDCPYMEVIYDPTVQMLVAMSKTMKENYEMLPRLDDNGEFIPTKKAKMNGRKMQEERRLMTVPQEFYIVERDEQESFIKKFAVNADTFDYLQYLNFKPKADQGILKPEVSAESGLLDASGKPLSVVK
jgi:hypothetical protein